MKDLRALIVDDEQLARQQMRRFLAQIPGVRVAGECESGEEAVTAISELRPDVVFLDVQMPVLDGFEVIETVGAHEMPPVVFVTAHEEHAVRAFRAHALDYLLKPVDPADVVAVVERVRASPFSGSPLTDERLSALIEERAKAERYLKRFIVRDDGRLYVVPAERVDWIEADDNDVLLHVGRDTHRLRGTLAALVTRLEPSRFARIHRSAIVNLERVREVQPWFQGESMLFLTDGTRLAIGRTYREAFLEILGG
jgi:two-component system, LytTR family, response regulator